jgi:hypothetical protein
MIKLPGLFLLLPFLTTVICLSTAMAGPESTSRSGDPPSWLQAVRDQVGQGFSTQLTLLGFGVVQKPVNAELNPNNVLEIPRYQVQ